jgi:catechol 2,3-dioxygenase-like lactoylglutathione lyase family enzyme
MQVQHIDHVNLSVADFEDSAEWYARVFGFRVVERGVQDGEPWGVLRGGDAMLCVYQKPDFEFVDRFEKADRRLHTISHFGLRISDGEEFERIIASEELEVLYGGPIRWQHGSSWYVTDPTGHEIEVALWDENIIVFDDDREG